MPANDYRSIGYLDYPQTIHRPEAGTQAEIDYSNGWSAAHFNASNHSEIDEEYLYGRNTYAADYWHGA